MQLMVDMCVREFAAIGMSLNVAKSGCLRIGERHGVVAEPIFIDKFPLDWKLETRYLGINIVSGRKFKINCQATRQKFFAALNSIFGKVGPNSAPNVLCSLIASKCVPILMFAAESLLWNKKSMSSMENAYNQAFFKIFKTFDKQIIESCQYYMGFLPFRLLLDVRKLTFLMKLRSLNYIFLHTQLNGSDKEFSLICDKYNFSQGIKFLNVKYEMWQYFERSLST
jgi:hypothetical protein